MTALRHIRDMVAEPDQTHRLDLLFSEKPWLLWQSLVTHVGLNGMCGVCLDICPVGQHPRPPSLKEKALAVHKDRASFQERYRR